MNKYNIFPKDIIDYPEDIAAAIKSLLADTDAEIGEETQKELVDGLYYLRACAENEHNSNYFRVLYAVLAKLSEFYN